MKGLKYNISMLLTWVVSLALTAQNSTPTFVVDYQNEESATLNQSGIGFASNADGTQYSLSNNGHYDDNLNLSKVKSISRYYEPPVKHIYSEDDQSEAVVDEVKEDGTVVLEPDAKVIPKVGEIIVSGEAPGAPDGFLYRVEEVVNKDGKVELKTSPAYLNELFDECNVRIPLQSTEIESFVRADGKVFYPVKRSKEIDFIDIDTTFVIKTDTVKDIQSESWFKDFKAELGIKLGAKLHGTFVAEKKSGIWDFERIGFELDGDLSVDVQVKLGIKKQHKFDPIFLGDLKLGRIPISVMGIPVTLNPVIKVLLVIEMDGSVSLTFTPVKFKVGTSCSVMYTDEPDHVTGERLNCSFDPPSWNDIKKNFTLKGMLANFLEGGIPDFSMKGSVKAALNPLFQVKFYNRKDLWLALGIVPYVKLTGELTVNTTLDFGDDDYDLGGNVTVTDGVNVDWGLDIEGSCRLPFRIPGLAPKKDNVYSTPTWHALDGRLWSIASLFPNYSDFWLSPEKNVKDQPYVHITVNKEIPSFLVFDEDDFGVCYRTKGSIDWTYVSLKGKYPNITNTTRIEYELPTTQLEDNKTYIIAPYTHIKTAVGGFYILRKGGSFKTGENDSTSGGDLDIVPGEDL